MGVNKREKIIHNPSYEDCLKFGWKNGDKNVVMGQAEHSNEVDIWMFSPDDFGGEKLPYSFIIDLPDFPNKVKCVDTESIDLIPPRIRFNIQEYIKLAASNITIDMVYYVDYDDSIIHPCQVYTFNRPFEVERVELEIEKRYYRETRRLILVNTVDNMKCFTTYKAAEKALEYHKR